MHKLPIDYNYDVDILKALSKANNKLGETKMQVTVFTPVTIDEDIEDLDIEVNEDFLR